MKNGVHEYLPFKGTQVLSFGMTRSQVRDILGKGYRSFLRNELAESATDYYEHQNLFIEYDKNDSCEALEFSKKGALLYEERDLFDFDYNELLYQYNPISKNKEIEGDFGVTYFDLGFGVTRSNDGNEIESIIIFSETYWNKS